MLSEVLRGCPCAFVVPIHYDLPFWLPFWLPLMDTFLATFPAAFLAVFLAALLVTADPQRDFPEGVVKTLGEDQIDNCTRAVLAAVSIHVRKGTALDHSPLKKNQGRCHVPC